MLTAAEAGAENTSVTCLKVLFVNTEVITQAYTDMLSDLIVLFYPHVPPDFGLQLTYPAQEEISRQESVFQPSFPSQESTLPPVIREANSCGSLQIQTHYLSILASWQGIFTVSSSASAQTALK